MNTERTEKFVNAIACDLEEGGFRQVSGTTLRRTLATAVSAALPLLADTGIPASQPAELAEQQGDALLPCPFCGESAERIDFGPGAGDNEGGSCVACTGCGSSGPVEFGFKENFRSIWNRRALAATGKQVDPAWSLHDRVEFALRDAGFDLDEASRIALQVDGEQQVGDLPDDVVERCRTLPTDKLLNCALEVYARSCMYGTKGQHDAAMAYKDEIIRRIGGCAVQVGEVQGGALPPLSADEVAAMAPAGLTWDETGAWAMGYEACRKAALAARQPGATMSAEASQVARGMVTHCIEHRLCMGMDEGFASFDPDVEHPFVRELRGFADGTTSPAQGIDLGRLQLYRLASGPLRTRGLHKDDTGSWVKIQDVERLIGQRDAAPGVGNG